MRSLSPLLRRCSAALSLLLLALAGCSDRLPLDPAGPAPLVPGAETAPSLNTTPPGHIRIGVVPSVNELLLGGTGEFVLRDKASGAELLQGTNARASVTIEALPTLATFYRLQVACTGSETTRDAWIAKVEAAGYEAYTEYVSSALCWRLRVGRITQAQYSDATFRNAWSSEVIAQGLSPSGGGFWTSFTETVGEMRLRVSLNGEVAVATSPVVVEARTGHVLIGSLPYRGRGEALVNSVRRLAGVNELLLEEYLYGVVPRELPPVPYGELEAQKAQAVAARTYAVANLGKRRANGYDLLPTDSDQVYGGAAAEHAVSTAAVEATAGEVAVHNGRLISTLYHSTSGGYTANSEDVYANAFPYLRGVPDAERGEAMEHVPTLEVFKRHANPTNLRAHAEGDFESDWSRYHRWVVTWSKAEMARALSQGFGRTITEVHSVEVTDRADHGRVREIRFQTDAGELVGVKDAIRWRLRYVTATNSLASLRSTLFFIEPTRDPETGEVTGWKAYGGGWGHGVGLSQTGAVGMAKAGRTYREILKHYYQGSTLASGY